MYAYISKISTSGLCQVTFDEVILIEKEKE